MAYAVELSRRAIRDLQDLYEYLHAADSAHAQRWFNGLEEAIYSLELYPRRYSPAPETGKTPPLLRHLLYGDKPNVYRVLYKIEEKRKIVRVITIRHGARDEWKTHQRARRKS